MRKGINYDIGTFTRGRESSSRDKFDFETVKREVEIIKNDLHCNSIRISGEETKRLIMTAEYALKQGLEVWLSPAFINANEEETLIYFSECAKAAELLRVKYTNIIFVAGCELTFFMKGLVSGDTPFNRINTFMKPWLLIKSTIINGSFNKRLNKFLLRATGAIKENFKGKLTYASGIWENVDWRLFDFIGIDYYREKSNKNTYREKLRAYFKLNKPVIITEFGCCTYKGAEEKGGYGWAIVDRSEIPNKLNGEYIRDESVQSDYIIELMNLFKEEKIEGEFVFTFISTTYPYNKNPLYDLDIASLSIVKTFADKNGIIYEDMPWEPKKSFYSIAEHYSKI